MENGATHVLALRSRPDGCFVEVEPATYEKIVAPVYFRLNRIPMVGEFFESGGSQYRYLEDVLTLDEGLAEGIKMSSSSEFKGVKVPPTDILFGTKDDRHVNVDPDSWARAHLLPIILPANTPELPSLTQEKDEVLMAVRNGYATAFDVLAPIAGLNFDPATVNSKRIAEMIFPSRDDEAMYVLENPVKVKGDVIVNIEQEKKAQRRFVSWIARKRQERKEAKSKVLRNPLKAAAVEAEMESPGIIGGKADSLDWLEAEALLAALPGFRGKLDHLAGGLRSQNQTSTKISSS